MVEVITDVEPHVAAFRVSGSVTKEDYELVIVPTIGKLSKSAEKIHFLLVIETDISNFTGGALFEDLWLGIKNITRWHRMAIVSDQPAVRKFTDAVSFPIPGEAKGFALAELAEAKKWVAL